MYVFLLLIALSAKFLFVHCATHAGWCGVRAVPSGTCPVESADGERVFEGVLCERRTAFVLLLFLSSCLSLLNQTRTDSSASSAALRRASEWTRRKEDAAAAASGGDDETGMHHCLAPHASRTTLPQVKGATSQPHKEDKKVAPTLQAVCKVCGASLSLSAMKPAVCLKCSTPLPKCSVCVKTLGIGVEDAFSHQITWCLSCCHGGHVSHLVDWFESHETCPVAGCDCTCATLD